MRVQALKKQFDHTTANGTTELEAHVHCRLGGDVRDFRLVLGDKGLLLRGYALTY